MENAGKLSLSEPSLTETTMPPKCPALEGVPLMIPECVFTDAQEGSPATLNVRVSPFESEALGVKE
jgi:hypothetical protein